MSIFKSKTEFDKYKGKTVVLNSIRTDKATAVKIDELVQVCNSETEDKISKNHLLKCIVTKFINGIENTASTDEDKAIKELLDAEKHTDYPEVAKLCKVIPVSDTYSVIVNPKTNQLLNKFTSNNSKWNQKKTKTFTITKRTNIYTE